MFVGVLGVACVLGTSLQAADVVAMGDSMMRTVARVIRREMSKSDISVESSVTIGSGLARLDLFDWHFEAQNAMKEHTPKTVIVMMGANDNQPMRTDAGVLPFKTPGWEIEYGRRTGQFMDLMLEGGAERVIWLGLPCMREADLSQSVAWMQEIVQKQADARDKVTFFPTKPLFCQDGTYSSYIKQGNGMPLEVRAPDGIHLSRSGAEYLADVLMKEFFTK
jgi:hypothetical protein